MKFIPGATFLPPDDGENTARRFLEEKLHDDEGYILSNVYVRDHNNQLCEMDFVVINQNGIYDVEVKNWAGALVAGIDAWETPSGSRPNPSQEAESHARILKGYLKRESSKLGRFRTIGLVLLVRGLLKVSRPGNYPFMNREFGMADDGLIRAIRGRDHVYPDSPRLRPDDMKRACDVLAPHHDQPRPLQIANFQVTSQGRTHPYYVELNGYDVELHSRHVRIKAYRLESFTGVPSLMRAVERFKRELMALHAAGDHENLVKPIIFERDLRSNNNYFLVLEHTGLDTLAAALARGPLPAERRRVVLRDVASALAFCHGKGFIHRSLSPDAIYLTREGRAKVGDFDLARLPGYKMTVTTGRAALLTGRYVAPEQRRDIHNADARADVFALGVVWYDMLFAPPAAEVLRRERLDGAPLDEPAKELLRRMTADDPAERPPTMADVLRELDALTGV